MHLITTSSTSDSHKYSYTYYSNQIMISNLHQRTQQQLSANRLPRHTETMHENRLNDDTTDNSSLFGEELERICIKDNKCRSFNQSSSSTFGSSTRRSMSHLTADEPVLDEMEIEELLDHVRARYGNGC